jgi:hypothetical protein
VTPVSGRIALTMGTLAAAAILYAAFYLVLVVESASRFANPTNAITFPLQGTERTTLPAGIAPDSFGYFTSATLSSSGVTWWPRAWLSVADLTGGLLHVAVALVVAAIALRAVRGRLLEGGLSRLLLLGGLAVAIGGTATRAFEGWGVATARAELIAQAPGSLLTGPGLPLGDWLPLLIGLAIVGVAIAVRTGERAQRDIAGLV